MESLSEIEEFLIRGMVYIFDVSGITASYLKITPIEDIIRISKNAEKCVVGRHKGFHIVNVPAALSYVINIAIKTAPQKIRERVKFYSSFEQLGFVDKKHLPKEYGGTIPMKEMSSKMLAINFEHWWINVLIFLESIWDMLTSKRELHMKYLNMKVDANLYPKACLEGSIEMLKIPLSSPDLFEKASRCNDESIFGVQGSFRKLEID